MQKAVTRVTQSPMNPKQWALDLECGHEVWVTATHRPNKKRHDCPKCSAEPSNK